MNEDQYAEIHAQLAANEAEHHEFKRRLDNHADALKKQSEILVLLERQSNAIERILVPAQSVDLYKESHFWRLYKDIIVGM